MLSANRDIPPSSCLWPSHLPQRGAILAAQGHPARSAWHCLAVCHLAVELCLSVFTSILVAVIHCGNMRSVYCAAQMAAAKPTLVLVALAAALPAALGLSNAVVQWQNATEQVVRDFNISNQISAKYYALADIAQFQALLANADSRDKINSTAVTGTASCPVTLPAAMPGGGHGLTHSLSRYTEQRLHGGGPR